MDYTDHYMVFCRAPNPYMPCNKSVHPCSDSTVRPAHDGVSRSLLLSALAQLVA
jgi:hypothetical protein